MNFSWKDFFEFLLLFGTFIWGIIAFIMTQKINHRSKTIEHGITSLNKVFDKEMELKLDSKRISREKVLELIEKVQSVLGRVMNMNHESVADLHNFLMGDMRDFYWSRQIYIPNEILTPMSDLFASSVQAVNLFGFDRQKYGDLLEKIRGDYAQLVSKIRQTYYFETHDSSAIIQKAMRSIEEAP